MVSETMLCVFYILILKLQAIILKYVMLFRIEQLKTMSLLELDAYFWHEYSIYLYASNVHC